MTMVNIPGFGQLHFDDSMSKDEINASISKMFPQQSENAAPNSLKDMFSMQPSQNGDNLSSMLGINEPLNSIAAGARAGYEKLPLGVMQGLHIGNPDIVKQIFNENKMSAEEAAQKYPKLTKFANFLGGLAGGAPLMAIPGLGEAGSIPAIMSQGAIQGGALGAGQYVEPGQSRLLNTAAGTVGGAALSPLVRGLASPNPYVKLGTGATLGGVGGYESTDTKGGALEGGLAGAAAALLPQTASAYGGRLGNQLLQKLGMSPQFSGRTPIQDMAAIDMLQGANTPEAQARLEASKRLGLKYLTPAEASSNPALGMAQGKLGTSKEGALTLQQKGQQREQSEKNIIGDFLDSISPPNAQETLIKPLYKQASTDTVKPEVLKSLFSEPTIKAAFDAVQNNPYYARELKDVPINSIQYMDQVKKYLDDIANKTSKKEGQQYLAGLQSKDSQALTSVMDKASPTYASARHMAKVNFIRNDIEDMMNQGAEGASGTGFFKNVLNKDKNFNDFYDRLSYAPDVQQKLTDMRSVFKDLINPMNAQSAATLAQRGTANGLNLKDLLHDAANKLISGSYDRAAIKLITSPNWDTELHQIARIQDKTQRSLRMADLLSKVGTYSAVQAASNAK